MKQSKLPTGLLLPNAGVHPTIAESTIAYTYTPPTSWVQAYIFMVWVNHLSLFTEPNACKEIPS